MSTWLDVKEKAVEGVKSVFPIEGKKRSLHLDNVEIKDDKESTDYDSQKQSVLNKVSWTVPVYANLTMKDNTGKTLEKKRVRLMAIPKLTSRGTIIHSGNEYSIANQLRLKPGVYTTRGNDDIVTSQFNVDKGANFEISQDPKTGVFFMGIGTSFIPLYPILKEAGVSDKDIASRWGSGVLNQNMAITRRHYENAVKKAYKKLSYDKEDVSFEQASKELGALLAKGVLDPDSTELTLGKKYTNVSPVAMIDASKKVMDINRGSDVEDDRESLLHKKLFAYDDFVKEVVEKGTRTLVWKTKNRLDNMYQQTEKNTVAEILPSGSFSKPLYDNINASQLISVVSDANPIAALKAARKTTSFGAGGIRSVHAIPDALRNIHPSQMGFLDPVTTPESSKVGIESELSIGTSKKGSTLETQLIDRNGKRTSKTIPELKGKVVAFPGQDIKKEKVISAVKDGKVVDIKASEVDYIIPHESGMFSYGTNLIPFLGTNDGKRANMGDKMAGQALSLKHREAPLVQVESGTPNMSSEQLTGEVIAKKSPIDGTVTSVTNKAITITGKDGTVANVSLYDNYGVGKKSYLNDEPLVVKGDKVKAGQLIADNNYTKNGVLALGTNLRTLYAPYKGLTFEDSIITSESGAKKLTSQHLIKYEMDITPETVLGKDKYLAYFPSMSNASFGSLDGKGVVKKGTKLNRGDYIMAAVRERTATPEDLILKSLKSKLVKPFKDVSVVWEEDTGGEVIDVNVNPKNAIVTVRVDKPLVVGDKLTNRMGGKGVVATILPDAEMPKDSEGNAYDVILNPATVVSRMNVGQLLETASSKTASNDNPYIAPSFYRTGEQGITDRVKKRLKDSGVKDVETVLDATGADAGKMFAGRQYFYKLGKTVDSGFSARAFNGDYDADMIPAKGGTEGAKTVGRLELYSLISHNARNNLRDIVTYKAEYNPELIKAIQLGAPLPPPKPTFAFEKFINYLKGAGVNVEKSGDRFKLTPLVDKDILSMSAGKVGNAKMLTSTMTPEKGGLFDFNTTGGTLGKRWAHIELSEPVINSVFEEPVRRLLGMTQKELLKTQREKGGEAIRTMLGQIDVDEKLKSLDNEMRTAKGVKLDNLVKQTKYLKVLKDANIRPDEAYTIKNVPVIPPQFRPIYQVGDTPEFRISDVNKLYRQVKLVNEGLEDEAIKDLPDSEKSKLRHELYAAVKTLQGIDKPSQLSGQEYKGFIAAIKGNIPKEGFFQSKVLAKRQDIAGRAVIGADPSLDIDEIKIPEDMAWTLYGPFVVRELVKLGTPVMDAKKEVDERSLRAKEALIYVMKDRPAIINRAPTLHKYSIMAFKPKMHSGKNMLIPPMVMKSFGADVDGDQMQVHIPVSEEAKLEAVNKMLPSQNLFSILDRSPQFVPSGESTLGLYFGTRHDKKPSVAAKKYTDENDVKNDIKARKLKPTDAVLYKNMTVPAGSVFINSLLPEDLRDYSRVLDKKGINSLMDEVAKKYPDRYPVIAKKLKDAGDYWAFVPESSFTLNDLSSLPEKEQVLSHASHRLSKIRRRGAKGVKDDDIVNIYSEAQAQMVNAAMDSGKRTNNAFYNWVASGSKGKPIQYTSIVGAPVIVTDVSGKVVPCPITRGFAEGLSAPQYFTSLFGARKGMVDTKLEVSEPGALAKEMVAANIDLVVTMVDCGTRNGKDMSISDRDALERYLSIDVHDKKGHVVAKRNDLTSSGLIDRLRRADVAIIKVRSPITCEAPKGVCSYCVGIQENGKNPPVGENVGTKYSMSLTEPLTQIALSSKHTSGIANTNVGVSAFRSLVEMPDKPQSYEVLSEQNGVVDNIKELPTGGKMVTVKGKDRSEDYFVSPLRQLLVSKDRHVGRGDAITDGTTNIGGIVALNGMDSGRERLANALTDFYRNNGIKIHKKVPETIARGILNYAKVIDPGDYDYIPNDIVEYNQTVSFNKKEPVNVNVKDSEGWRLNKDYGGLKAGDKIDFAMKRQLARKGVRDVEVFKSPLVVEPIVMGINKIPGIKPDWIGQMGFKRLSSSIMSSAATGGVSNIHSLNPVPALSYGAEFGKFKDVAVY